jgi:HK97 family phage major capsid protein
MSDFKTMVRDMTKALEAKQAEAGVKWAAFDKVKTEALGLGADLLTNEDAFKKLDDAGKDYDGACDEVNALQAKLARLTEIDGSEAAPTPGGAERKADPADVAGELHGNAKIGERFLKSAAYAHLQNVGAMSGNVVQIGSSPSFMAIPAEEFKATMVTTDYPSLPSRRPGIVGLPQETLDVLDLISIIQTASDTIEWVVEKTFTNAAAETPENDATGAPEGAIDFDKLSTACQWIPFFLPTTRQILNDEPRLRAWIETRMVYGVRHRLQDQVIAGTGLLGTLKGITHTPNVLTHAKGADTVLADVIHKAKTAVIVQTSGNYVPSSVVLHPNDNERLVLSKDGNARYFFGGPGSDGVSTIWGMRPIVHPAVAEGSPLVGDFNQAELYVREGVSVNVSDSHADFFRRSLLAWLAGGRFALAVLQPAAFCQVTGFNA